MEEMNLLGRRLTPYSDEVADLRQLRWDFKSTHSTDGVAPKFLYGGKFYKLPSFNKDAGFYGDEAVTECVVSDILDTMGVVHTPYSLIRGSVIYDGSEYITPVCVADDFNPQRRPSISLERLIRSSCPGLSPLDACIRMGFADYIYTMFLVDFLILNRDRHGANIEIIDGTLIPLFDHGAALVALNDYRVWNHWAGDRVNNFVGSYSLRENLGKIPGERWPVVNPPDVTVLQRFQKFWPDDKIAFVQQMLNDRWRAIEKRRLELQ